MTGQASSTTSTTSVRWYTCRVRRRSRQRRIQAWWLLVPLAVTVWALVHASGVHATVAGVLLGFAVPVLSRDTAGRRGLAEHFEHLLRPLSAGVAVPIFAFFAAGVAISGLRGLTEALTDRIAIGIIVGLVVGKTVGIFATSYLVARFTRATLNPDLRWVDLLGVAALAGIGFTVSLLIGELAYGVGGGRDEYVKIGVLAGSLLAAAVAAVILRSRNRAYRDLAALEECDSDADGIPDVYDATTQAHRVVLQITDPRAAAYEIADYLQAIDQLTVTTLRNVIGSMDLEQTLTSREEINSRLRIVLDEATGKWGIRVNRVEIKAFDPRSPSRRRWRSRCEPSGTSAQPSCTPKANGRPKSLPPKGSGSKRSWWPKATSRPRSSGPTVRPGPSTWFSRPSTATTQTRRPRRSPGSVL